MADTWYYSDAGKAAGPHSLEDLQQLVTAGRLAPDDQVTSDGQTWRRAADFAELHFSATASQASILGYHGRAATNPVVTDLAVDLLRQTGLWVRIMSVMMFVSSALMLCGGVFILLASALIPRGRAAVPPVVLGIIYIPFAALYIIPAIYLWRYASYAKSFAQSRDVIQLEGALASQKSFWKFVAVLTLIIIGLYIIAIPIMVFIGFSTAKVLLPP